MTYLLTGPDRYLVETEIRRITQLADPEGLNTARFDKSASLSEIASAVSTMGFFGTSRVVVAEVTIPKTTDDSKKRKTVIAGCEEILASVAPGNVLIMFTADLKAFPRDIEKAAGTDHVAFTAVTPRGTPLSVWVMQRFEELGATIGRREVDHLLHRRFPGDWQAPSKNPLYDNPPDLQALIREIEKISTACLGRPIEIDDIDALISTETQDRLFPLIDAITMGNGRDAFRMLTDHGDDDDSSARVLNMLNANAELGQIAASLSGDLELNNAAKELGQANSNRLAQMKRNFSTVSAATLGNQMLESDRRLKTGIVLSPSAQLHEVIVRRASKTRDR